MAKNFSSDAIAEIDGLPDASLDFSKPQMTEKSQPVPPPNQSAITRYLVVVCTVWDYDSTNFQHMQEV